MIARPAFLICIALAVAWTPASGEETAPSPSHGPPMSALTLVGSVVKNRNNDTLGAVCDLLISPAGQVESVVLELLTPIGSGRRLVVLSYRDMAHTARGELVFDVSLSELRALPEFARPETLRRCDRAERALVTPG